MRVGQRLSGPDRVTSVELRLAEHAQQAGLPLSHRPAGAVRPDRGQAGRALGDRGLMGEDTQGLFPGRHRPIDHDLRVAGR